MYYIKNPERNISKIATESQLRYEGIIKDVFGVACKSDIQMMIKFNKGFRESICNEYGIEENEITLSLIFRIATKQDLIEYESQYVHKEDSNGLDAPFTSHI